MDPKPAPQSTRSATHPEPPPASTPAEVSPPPSTAAGFPAILHSLACSVREMGVARTADAWLKINQPGGFDCPSCAWAEPTEGGRHTFEFCENGAKALADDATLRRATPEFFASHSIEALGGQTDQWLNAQGRLTHPLVLWPGAHHYRPITWPEAFSLVAGQLNALTSPDEAVFYTSGKASNEAAFLFQLFARHFGTNNLPDCSNMCHESSGWGLRQTLGVGKSTVTLEDLETADCIVVIGQNPGTNHPRMLTSLQTAKRRGATILAVNPLKEVGLLRFRHPQEAAGLLGHGTELANEYLQVRINGDVALLKGWLKVLLEEEGRRPGEVLDHSFIRQYCSGFEEFAAHVEAAKWEEIVTHSGIAHDEIKRTGAILARCKSLVICWAMGLTQHRNGVENVRELVNLLLLRGNIGRPGAGALCVRGHSNVQGDRTMGIWEQMDDGFLDRLRREFHFEPPRRRGLDTIETIHALAEGKIKAFVSLGGNFLSATPDTRRVAEGLRRCRLTVSIATKLNRFQLNGGETALILPCLGRTERDEQVGGTQIVSVENTVNFVRPSIGHLPPASSHLMSEPVIIAGMAAATLGKRSRVDWMGLTADYDHIRDAVSRVVAGFEDFNQRLKAGGFYAPVPARERVFNTETGKACFTVNPMRPIPLEPGQFLMMTVRSHDQFNTVIYGMDDRYRGIRNGRRVVFVNRDDLAELGLMEGQWVDIASHHEGQERRVEGFCVVGYDIPRGCTASYFPETNALVPSETAAMISNTPISKSFVVTLHPAKEKA